MIKEDDSRESMLGNNGTPQYDAVKRNHNVKPPSEYDIELAKEELHFDKSANYKEHPNVDEDRVGIVDSEEKRLIGHNSDRNFEHGVDNIQTFKDVTVEHGVDNIQTFKDVTVEHGVDNIQTFKDVTVEHGVDNIQTFKDVTVELAYEVPNIEHVRVLKNLVTKISARWNVHIIPFEDDKTHIFKVTGLEENAKSAIGALRQADHEYTVEILYTYNVRGNGASIDSFENVLETIRHTCDVSIEHHVRTNTRAVKPNKEKHPLHLFAASYRGYHSWTFTGGHTLKLVKTTLIQCQANVVIDAMPETPDKEHVTQARTENGCIDIEIRIPKWNDGITADDNCQKLEKSIYKALTTIDRDHNESIGISINPFKSKELKSHVTALAHATAEFFRTASTERRPRLVVFCTDNEDHFQAAVGYIEICLNKINIISKPIHQRDRLRVRVVQGELNKTRADVLVNTTASNLDLAHGYVSTALLKSAGPDIQHECNKQYPNGINKSEIAITRGYDLPCTQVFHGALDKYSKETEPEIVEAMRSFIRICLETASYYGHRSIAFPAIGSGNLAYPASLVAAEMFSSIEKFGQTCRDTSIEEVYFVVYHTNVTVEQEFRKIEAQMRLEKPSTTEYGWVKPSFSPVTELRVSGNRDNVIIATSQIRNVFITSMANTTTFAIEKIPDVCRTAYIVLMGMYSETFAAFRKDGVIFCLSNGQLDLRGKLENVTAAVVEIRNKCKQVNEMYKNCFSLKGRNKHAAELLIGELNSKAENVHCCLDRIHSLIFIYGKSKEGVELVINRLTSELTRQVIKANSPSIVQRVENETAAGDNDDANVVVEIENNFQRGRNSLSVCSVVKNDAVEEENVSVYEDEKAEASSANTDEGQSSGLSNRRRTTFHEGVAEGNDKYNPSIRRATFSGGKTSSKDELNLFAPLYIIEDTDRLQGIFTYSQKVIIYTGDILKLDGISVIVCSEDRSGKANGMVAKKLLSMGKTEYAKEKNKAFQSNPDFGDIVVTGGGASKYRYVMHVIVPFKNRNVLLSLVEGILEEAVKRKFESVVMSLLGTGAGNYVQKESAEVLFEGYSQFCQRHLDTNFTLYIVDNDKRKTAVVITVFRDNIDKLDQIKPALS